MLEISPLQSFQKMLVATQLERTDRQAFCCQHAVWQLYGNGGLHLLMIIMIGPTPISQAPHTSMGKLLELQSLWSRGIQADRRCRLKTILQQMKVYSGLCILAGSLLRHLPGSFKLYPPPRAGQLPLGGTCLYLHNRAQ